MNAAPTTYPAIQDRIAAWAKMQPAIQAVLLVGSRARKVHPADEWADLDLILYTTSPQKYIDDPTWLAEIGPLWAKTLNTTTHGEAEWLVLYKGALKVDYFLVSIPENISSQASIEEIIRSDPYHHNVFARGVRVLFSKNDPENLLEIPPRQRIDHNPITQQSFSTLVDHILLDLNRIAKLLRRGDVLRAWRFSQVELKDNLLTLIGWQARAKRGANIDTWYDGRFIADWCDPQVLAQFHNTFARCDAEELWQALFNAHTLFSCLAVETAETLSLEFAIEVDREILDWNRAAYANR